MLDECPAVLCLNGRSNVPQLISLLEDMFEFIRRSGEMVTDEAYRNVVLCGGVEVIYKWDSPVEHEKGGGSLENLSSVSLTKSSHLASRMLV